MKSLVILFFLGLTVNGNPTYPIHPGVGAIYKGPNSETIIKGPDGSVITAEAEGGEVDINLKKNPIVVEETALVVEPVGHAEAQAVAKGGGIAEASVGGGAAIAKASLAAEPVIVEKHAVVAEPVAAAHPVVVSDHGIAADGALVGLAGGHGVAQAAVVEESAIITKPIVGTKPVVVVEPPGGTDLVGPSGAISTRGSHSIVAGPASTSVDGHELVEPIVAEPVVAAVPVVAETVVKTGPIIAEPVVKALPVLPKPAPILHKTVPVVSNTAPVLKETIISEQVGQAVAEAVHATGRARAEAGPSGAIVEANQLVGGQENIQSPHVLIDGVADGGPIYGNRGYSVVEEEQIGGSLGENGNLIRGDGLITDHRFNGGRELLRGDKQIEEARILESAAIQNALGQEGLRRGEGFSHHEIIFPGSRNEGLAGNREEILSGQEQLNRGGILGQGEILGRGEGIIRGGIIGRGEQQEQILRRGEILGREELSGNVEALNKGFVLTRGENLRRGGELLNRGGSLRTQEGLVQGKIAQGQLLTIGQEQGNLQEAQRLNAGHGLAYNGQIQSVNGGLLREGSVGGNVDILGGRGIQSSVPEVHAVVEPQNEGQDVRGVIGVGSPVILERAPAIIKSGPVLAEQQPLRPLPLLKANQGVPRYPGW